MLAIYCLGALDEVKKLIGILGDQDPTHAPDRDTAIFTLRRWLGRDARQGLKLYDEKNKSGLLLSDPGYKSREAEAIYVMLHDFNEEDRFKPETYELLASYLLSDKVAIAELVAGTCIAWGASSASSCPILSASTRPSRAIHRSARRRLGK